MNLQGNSLVERINMNNLSVKNISISLLDTETTGLESDKEILEVGIVRVHPDGSREEFQTLVKPSNPVELTEIHRITQEEVEEAPSIADTLAVVKNLVQGTLVVAHNAIFDISKINQALARLDEELLQAPYACTKEGHATLFPQLRHSLKSCCEQFGIDLTGHHAALDDAKATETLLLKHLFPLAITKGKGFVAPRPWYDTVIPFTEIDLGKVHNRKS